MIKKLVRLVLFIALVFGINGVICLATIPGYDVSRFQNHYIAKDKNKYEVLIFGASDAMNQFDPRVADRVLGKETFNCGMFGTYYMGGQVYANFLNAITYQNPDTVILCVADCNEDNSDELEKTKSFGAASYHYYGNEMRNKFAKWQAYVRTSKYDNALEKIFEWKTQWVEDFDENTPRRITEGFRLLTEKGYWTYDEEWRKESDPRNKDYYKGFSSEMQHDWLEDAKNCEFEEFSGDYPDYGDVLVDGCDIEDIARYCNKHDIRIVMIPSITSRYSIASHINERLNFWAYVKRLAEQSGAEYYNPNIYRKDYVEFLDEDFAEDNHLNKEGSAKFTESICFLMNERQDGKNTDKYFYSDMSEWLNDLYKSF